MVMNRGSRTLGRITVPPYGRAARSLDAGLGQTRSRTTLVRPNLEPAFEIAEQNRVANPVELVEPFRHGPTLTRARSGPEPGTRTTSRLGALGAGRIAGDLSSGPPATRTTGPALGARGGVSQ